MRSLSNALETIQKLQAEDQATILRKAVDQTDIDCLDTILMPNIEKMKEAKLTNGLISYLKRFKLHRPEEKIRFCSLLWGICGDNLLDEDFVQWLAKKLYMCKPRLSSHIQAWLSVTTECMELRGRKGLMPETKQAIYNTWHTLTSNC